MSTKPTTFPNMNTNFPKEDKEEEETSIKEEEIIDHKED